MQLYFNDTGLYDEYKFVVTNVKHDLPKPKINYIKVPEADGVLDYTEAFGNIKYENRNIIIDGQIKGRVEILTDVMNDIVKEYHGKKLKITLPGDTGVYVGRVTVQYNMEAYYTNVAFSCDCEPHKYINGEKAPDLSTSSGLEDVVVGGGMSTADKDAIDKKIKALDEKIAAIRVPSLTGYATERWVKDKLPDLTGYAKKSDIPAIPTMPDLSGYAKKSDIPDISDKADRSELTQYAKKTDIPAGQDLSSYAKSHNPILTGDIQLKGNTKLQGTIVSSDAISYIFEQADPPKGDNSGLVPSTRWVQSEIAGLKAHDGPSTPDTPAPEPSTTRLITKIISGTNFKIREWPDGSKELWGVKKLSGKTSSGINSFGSGRKFFDDITLPIGFMQSFRSCHASIDAGLRQIASGGVTYDERDNALRVYWADDNFSMTGEIQLYIFTV